MKELTPPESFQKNYVKIFFRLAWELLSSRRVVGRIETGGRRAAACSFTRLELSGWSICI